MTAAPFALPALDLELSPYTGWTREHWAVLADGMLLAARPFASPSHARITFPGEPGGYGTDVDGLEGFARTFLAAGFRLVGDRGVDPHGFAAWYAEGIAAGTDPEHPERWVRPDEHGQAKVEAAAIALVLSMTREWIWDTLDERVRANTIAWFETVIGAEYPPINWVWFRIVVEQFLRSVGGRSSIDDLEHDLALHDTFAREGGWYVDGAERSYDHYAGWALHLYPVLWLGMTEADGTLVADGELGAPRRERYRAQLDRFLTDAAGLVGADGSPLVQGRSLIYRFAAAAPFWAGALGGSDTFAPGLVRRAASGIVKHFVDGGSFTADGRLTLGWQHEWRQLAQSYSGPGSPYWASKGLLGLALPAEHPVWTAVEEPLPVERADVRFTAQAPGWLVSGTHADGVVRVINHGNDHAVEGALVTDAPLYARFGYSTASSPLVDAAAELAPLDQSVVLLDAAGEPSHRAGFTTLAVRELDEALLGASRSVAHWVTPDPASPQHGSGHAGVTVIGPELTTVSVVRGAWEVRFVRVNAAGGESGVLRVGGWAVPEGAGLDTPASANPLVECPTEERGRAYRDHHPALSALHDLGGTLTASGTRIDLDATPLAARTATPWLATPGPAADGWHVAALGLSRDAGALASVPRLDAPPRVDVTTPVTIGWPDGASSVVDLSDFT